MYQKIRAPYALGGSQLALFKREKIDMGSGHVGSTLLKLAIPSICSMFFHTLFHLADTVFVSWLGEAPMAAMALTFPLTFIVFALVNGMCVGTTSLMSQHLGAGETEEAAAYGNSSLALVAFLSLIPLALVHPAVSGWFFGLLGGTPEVNEQCYRYVFWIILSFPFMGYSLLCDSFFRSQGDTVTPMYGMVVGNGLNILLDPLFIFTFGWGISGAAFASLLGRIASCVYMAFMLKRHSTLRPRPCLTADCVTRWRKITSIGLPVGLSQVSMALGAAVLNRVLALFGPGAIGAWMLGNRIEGLAFLPVLGINGALIPFIGFNLGRKDLQRVHHAVFFALVTAIVFMLSVGIPLFLKPGFFLAIFRPSAAIEAMASASIRASVTGYLFLAVDLVLWGVFQGSGYAVYGLIAQATRTFLFRAPLAYWFALRWGINGFWWFQPFSAILSVALSTCFIVRIMGHVKQRTLEAENPSA
jgi:putative MATE family efflux protein